MTQLEQILRDATNYLDDVLDNKINEEYIAEKESKFNKLFNNTEKVIRNSYKDYFFTAMVTVSVMIVIIEELNKIQPLGLFKTWHDAYKTLGKEILDKSKINTFTKQQLLEKINSMSDEDIEKLMNSL